MNFSLIGKRLPNFSFARRCASSNCPFQVLGLKSPSSGGKNYPMSITTTTPSYKEVSLAFRKLALRHHPDTANSQAGDETSDTIDDSATTSTITFTEIREAFEAIIEGPNGEAILRKNSSAFFQNSRYYRNNTQNDGSHYQNNEMDINPNKDRPQPHHHDDSNNLFHSSLNPQILREVAQVAETMNPGGLDKGGMWQYANMVNRMSKEEGRGLPPLRVDGGDAVGGKEGVTRRRRKKR